MTNRIATRSLLAGLTALCLSFATAKAQVYNEVGDAGQAPGTAQASGLSQPTTVGPTAMIIGSFGSLNDADVYSLTLTVPMRVVFSTVNALTAGNGGPGGLDTMLFLFTASGQPIYANDDASGSSLQSMLPGNSSFTMSLAPGTYLIAISLSGNEPINASNQLMFANGADSTSVRGPNGPLNPSTFSGFNSGAGFNQSGGYEIDISTAPVPEPSTLALCVLAFVSLGIAIIRKHKASAAVSIN
jgi:hypothetical protein